MSAWSLGLLRRRRWFEAATEQEDHQVVEAPLVAFRLLAQLLVQAGRQPDMDINHWFHGPVYAMLGLRPTVEYTGSKEG
jgi:hypothetical protein